MILQSMMVDNNFAQILINSTVDLIIVVDKELRYLTLNKAAREVFDEYFPEGVIGKKVDEVNPHVRTSGDYDRLVQALKGKPSEHKALKSSMSEKYYDASFTPLKNDEEVYAVLVITRDVTEAVRAATALKNANKSLEERKRFVETIIENSKEIIAVYDKDCRLITLNKACEDMIGFTREGVTGKLLTDIFPGIKGTKSEQDLLKALGGEVIQNLPYFSSLTGRYIQNYITPLRNNEGEIYAALAIATDVTELVENQQAIVHAHEELQKKNKVLERMNEEMKAFTYIASHDLKEPLRKIKMFATRMEKDMPATSDKGRDYVVRIVNAATRMQNLIAALFSYASLSPEEFKYSLCNLNDLLAVVMKNIAEVVEEKKAVVEIGELPSLYIIPFQFEQLFTNLIENSIKYSNHDCSPHVTINAAYVSDLKIEGYATEGNYWHILVVDNGIGFKSEYSDKIFKLFTRLHGVSDYIGNGIGLSICKKIVENHQGIINAVSQPGQGATFNIYIPDKER